jgi:hypothetical protein
MLATDLSADTRRLADALATAARGEIVTYKQLSEAIGRDIMGCRWLLYSALHVIERESGAVFATERRIGYRRLAPEEIVKIGQTARAHIRRTARAGARTISAGVAGANDLTPEMARQILAEQSALGLLEHVARDRNLPAVAETETRPLSVAATAREFFKRMGIKEVGV